MSLLTSIRKYNSIADIRNIERDLKCNAVEQKEVGWNRMRWSGMRGGVDELLEEELCGEMDEIEWKKKKTISMCW